MRKTLVLLLILFLAGFAFIACAKDAVSYCPFCGQSGIKEISTYDKDTGITEIYYECQNSQCGKKFGAGKIKATTTEVSE